MAGLWDSYRAAPNRNVIAASAIAWIPVALGSIHEPTNASFWTNPVPHARLLIVLPLYMLAGRWLVPELQRIAEAFSPTHLGVDANGYDATIARGRQLLTSRGADATILAIAFARALVTICLLNADTWPARSHGVPTTFAGWWYTVIALPIVFYVSGRWVWRFLVWTYCLGRFTRLPMRLSPSHPDNAGGIGFIGLGHSRFALLAFAANAGMSTRVFEAVVMRGEPLAKYEVAIAVIVVAEVLLVLFPLLLFSPVLTGLRRRGLGDYTGFGRDYVRAFDDKWIAAPRTGNDLLGTADLQSLADLSNSFKVVQGIKFVPVTRTDMLKILGLSVAPFLPLALTTMSVTELLTLLTSIVK